MDKSIYYKRVTFRLFGKKIWDLRTEYEGADIEDCKVLNPVIEQPIDFDKKQKEE